MSFWNATRHEEECNSPIEVDKTWELYSTPLHSRKINRSAWAAVLPFFLFIIIAKSNSISRYSYLFGKKPKQHTTHNSFNFHFVYLHLISFQKLEATFRRPRKKMKVLGREKMNKDSNRAVVNKCHRSHSYKGAKVKTCIVFSVYKRKACSLKGKRICNTDTEDKFIPQVLLRGLLLML